MNDTSNQKYNFLIIGAGFFGLSIAQHLRKKYPNAKILVLEMENEIMSRASYWNQSRVHNGYHYPRSLSTAIRSKENYDKFYYDWDDCILNNINSIYCISEKNSKTNSSKYEKFLSEIDESNKNEIIKYSKLFKIRNISAIYEAKEAVFDSIKIRKKFIELFDKKNIQIKKNQRVLRIDHNEENLSVFTNSYEYRSDYIFNCSYAGIYQFEKNNNFKELFRHELAEIALVNPPKKFLQYGITVMDGPFFSLLPFPSEKVHSISHVRYTPHFEWNASAKVSAYDVVKKNNIKSNFNMMIRDSKKFFPELEDTEYVNSFYEIKTILRNNDFSDSREIVISEGNKMTSFLGSKIDQVYDVLEYLDNKEINI